MQRLSSALSVLALASAALAQTIVIPNGMATAEGNSSNAFPWGRGGAGIRIQTIYDSSHFINQGVVSPVVITRLRWRPNTNVSSLASNLPTGATVSLSTCPVDQAAVGTSLAGNQGSDLTVVYNGPVSWPAAAAVAGPCPFLIDIPLQTPFVYNPSAGDLNIETDIPIQTFTGTALQLDVHTTSPLASRVYVTTGYVNGGPNDAGVVNTNHGVVVEVSYTPAVGLFPAFSATPTTGTSPLLVQFTDQTYTSDPGGVLAWQWDFDNDGTFDSTAQNPQHTYTQCGTYSVRLQVTDATGQQSITRTNLIVTDNVVASFTKQHLGGGVYQFTDTSTPTPTAWAWDFNGDNVIDSTAQNPTFTYPAGCASYNVTLTATLACRSSSASQLVSIIGAANTLTTLPTGNNGLTGANVGVFYDLTVLPAEGVSICALSVLPYSTAGLFTANMYIRPGTHVGNTSPASNWRLVGTGQGMSAGGTTTTAVLTDVAFTRPVYLPQGSYGVAVYIVPASGTMGHAYVTGTATNQNHGNADLQFVGGGSTTSLFPATLTTPRVWCGTFHYNKNSQTGDGGYGLFGFGCAGSQAVATNVATALPRLGQTMSATLNNLPVNAAFFVLGFSRTTSGFGPLPLDLTPFGAAGCFGRVSPDAVNLLTGSGGSLTWNLTIPNNPIYLGNQLYTQGIVVDPGFNSLGGVMSDAAAFIVGQ